MALFNRMMAICHHEVRAEVRVLVAGERVRRFLAEVEVDAARRRCTLPRQALGHVRIALIRLLPPCVRAAHVSNGHPTPIGPARRP